jgi:hypothetical protein
MLLSMFRLKILQVLERLGQLNCKINALFISLPISCRGFQLGLEMKLGFSFHTTGR